MGSVDAATVGADGFLSPDHATWCSANAKEVGCVSLPGAESDGAIVRRGGKVILCPVGTAGAEWGYFQNFGEKAPVLHYGSSAEIGPFRCASSRRGITCTVQQSGRGSGSTAKEWSRSGDDASLRRRPAPPRGRRASSGRSR